MSAVTCYDDVYPVLVSKDNYSYVLVDRTTNEAACVDPLKPQRVLDKVAELGVNLTTVLTTHNHMDHQGGNDELKSLRPDLKFIGSAYESTAGTTNEVEHNSKFRIGEIKCTALHVPCHTKGHMLFFCIPSTGSPILFTGDTLFIAGCGRFFMGTGADMLNNMDLISKLPDATRIYCGHEYTASNIKFALHVDGQNEKLQEKAAWVSRQGNKPTVPSVLGEEKLYNPFMRCHSAEMQMLAKTKAAVEVMTFLRSAKDSFVAA